MPDSSLPQNRSYADAPGGDISFDELFPSTESDVVVAPTTAQPTETAKPSAEAQPPQTPQESEPFLKAPTGTVYKTQEEAIRGIAHKDETIESLRQKVIAATGIDPLTEKQVGRPAPVETPQNVPVNYQVDTQRYWDDLTKAVQKGDPNAYAAVQSKFLEDALAPYGQLLATTAVTQAQEQVSAEISGFRDFRRSPQFQETLNKLPIFKDAIQQGESNPRMAHVLPELYRSVYWASQGLRTPELVKAVETTPVAAPAAQPARATLSANTSTPPPVGKPASLTTSEGRKALIAQYEERGLADVKW